MRRLLAFLLLAMLPSAGSRAQSQGHLGVRVTVLPPALRISITSAAVDFAQQHGDAGEVLLDPVTGEISGKAAGPHQLGVVQVTGRAGSRFAISVDAPHHLRGDQADVDYALRWAQSGECGGAGYGVVTSPRSLSGQLGDSGQACLRFGGDLVLQDVQPGVYAGVVQVRLLVL